MAANETPIAAANRILASVALSLHTFWIANLLKEGSPAVKKWLTFIEPVGPLSGLFIISLVAFFLFLFVLLPVRMKNQQAAYWFFVISTILFALLVFPPVFKLFLK